MNRKLFLDNVTKAIRMKEAKESVSIELNQHIEAVVSDYVLQGDTEEIAEQKAIQQMGSPEKLSKQFNKLYKRKIEWSVFSLFLCSICMGIIPMLLFNSSQFYYSWTSKIGGIVIGIAFVIGLWFLNYRKWQKFGLLFFAVGSVLLLLANSSNPFVVTVNGQPKFHFGPFTTDTSIVLILYLVAWAALLNNKKTKAWMLCMFTIISSALTYYIALSFSIIVMHLFMLMMMYAISRKENLNKVIIVLCSWIIVGWSIIAFNIQSYQIERLQLFLNPQADPNGIGFISSQAKKMIEQTTWFPQSIGKNEFLISEFHTDLVFTTITYSLGWGFSLLLLFILAFFLGRLIILTKQVNDPFGKTLIVGAISLFAFQIIYNIGMSFGILPFAGVSLPFISYGSTSLIINSIIIGIILSVYARKDIPIVSQTKIN